MDNITELVAELFADNSIGAYPERNFNRADSYNCPSCGGFKNIQGHAYGMVDIATVKHDEGCKLWQLYVLINSNQSNAQK